jgi:hypothetical protein
MNVVQFFLCINPQAHCSIAPYRSTHWLIFYDAGQRIGFVLQSGVMIFVVKVQNPRRLVL